MILGAWQGGVPCRKHSHISLERDDVDPLGLAASLPGPYLRAPSPAGWLPGHWRSGNRGYGAVAEASQLKTVLNFRVFWISA